MPVYGAIDLEIQADSAEDIYTKYEEIKESILNSEVCTLNEDIENSYIVDLNKKEVC